MKQKLIIFLLSLFIIPNLCFANDHNVDDIDHINVGIYQNDPVVFHEYGKAKGLYPKIIEYIADREDWEIEYVICTFAKCLDLMKENKIDIMTSIVDIEERRDFVTFSKVPTWDYYGIIFSYDPGVTGLYDLEGKTIGVRKASVYTIELIKLLKSFDINANIIPYDDYDIVFDDLSINKIDIAAVNNTFSYIRRDIDHIYQTPIVYSPYSSVWATPKGSIHEPKLTIIDKYIIDLKNTKGSIYYEFKEDWFSKRDPYWTTHTIILFIGVPVCIIIIMLLIYHYYTVLMMNLKLKDINYKFSDQKRFLNTVLDELPAMLAVYDTKRKPIRRNKKHYETLGYLDDDYDLFDNNPFVDPSEQLFVDNMFNLELGDKLKNITINLRTQSGQIIPHKYSVTSFPWSNEKYILVIGININNQIIAQKEKEKLESKLQQAQKMEAIGILAGGIAHDFNNILTVILGYTEVIKDNLVMCNSDRCAKSIEQADIVLSSADKAKKLIYRILTFSRQGESDRIKLNVKNTLDEAVVMIRQTLPTTIGIKTDINDVGHIYADPVQFHQIIMNMCINSFHSMGEKGGELSLGLYKVTLTKDDLLYEDNVKPGYFVKISIRDTGCGISDEIKDKIFNPYFTTKSIDDGTGMGLSIVYGIIKQYDGFIQFHSKVNEGTVFNLFIPLYNGESFVNSDVIIHDLNGNERILVIDDETLIAEVNKQLLERFGYKVTVETDSIKALSLFQNDPYAFDLVITDQTMPILTGFELSQKMLKIRNDIPIILCSGYSSTLSDDKLRKSGIREYALKPILKNDLAKLIRKVLNNT